MNEERRTKNDDERFIELGHLPVSNWEPGYEGSTGQFSSVKGIYALGKAHVRPTPSLRRFPSASFETVPVFVWLTMALSLPFREDRLALPHSTPLSSRRSIVWCPWLCARSNVSSSSTLQIFREASRLWGLLCPPVYLLGPFPSLRHVQGNTPTGGFEGGCRPSTYSSLGLSFHFSLFVARSLNRWGWGHVWSDCHLEATQRKAGVTASTFVVKLEVDIIIIIRRVLKCHFVWHSLMVVDIITISRVLKCHCVWQSLMVVDIITIRRVLKCHFVWQSLMVVDIIIIVIIIRRVLKYFISQSLIDMV